MKWAQQENMLRGSGVTTSNGRGKDYTKEKKRPELRKECRGREKLSSCAFPDGGQIDSSRESQSRLPNGVRLTLYGPVGGRHLVPELFTRRTTRRAGSRIYCVQTLIHLSFMLVLFRQHFLIIVKTVFEKYLHCEYCSSFYCQLVV